MQVVCKKNMKKNATMYNVQNGKILLSKKGGDCARV